jgi:hypothetical protein
MSESTQNCKEMQSAKKMTLPQFSTEVSKFMDRNNTATKLVGTAWSRVLDVMNDLQTHIEEEPDIVFRGVDLLERITHVESCLKGSFELSLDSTTHTRLNVANRVDVAMGIDHLRVDPLKKESDDFTSDDTCKLVEAAALKKQNLTWAKQGVFPGSRMGNFSHKPPSKSTGGGFQQSNGRGRGRGKSSGRGKGGGRGRGKGGGGKGGGTPKDKAGNGSSGGD